MKKATEAAFFMQTQNLNQVARQEPGRYLAAMGFVPAGPQIQLSIACPQVGPHAVNVL